MGLFEDRYHARYASTGTKPEDSVVYSDDCYLMDYVDVFVSMNQNICNPNGYNNFKVMDASPTGGGSSTEIISRLTCRDGLRRFLDITPAQMSILQPKVRLYKLIYSREGGKPIKEEFLFDDHYNRQSVDAILGGKMKRIGGAGLTEVNWVLNGTNPAEAKRCIEVEMSFEFQGAADWLGDRYSDNGMIKVSEELDKKAHFIDMILHPPSKEDSLGPKAFHDAKNGKYIRTYYTILLEVGWAMPDLGTEKKFPGLTLSETKDLRDSLAAQSMGITLCLQDHKIDVQENGGISVTATYNGAIETALNSPDANILDTRDSGWTFHADSSTAQAGERTKARIQDLEERIKCLKVANSQGRTSRIAGADGVYSNEDRNLDKAQEDLLQIEAQLKVNEEAARLDEYEVFLESVRPKIRKVEMSQTIVGEWQMSIDQNKPRPDFFAEAADGGLYGIYTAVVDTGTHKRGLSIGEYNPDTVTASGQAQLDALGVTTGKDGYDVVMNSAMDGAIRQSTDKYTSEVIADEKDTTTRAEAVSKTLNEQAEDIEKSFLRFIFLGDLIEAACGMMGNPEDSPSGITPDFGIITGPVVFDHPRGISYKFNLADLPISYERLSAYFLNNVVKTNLPHLPVRQFIHDILNMIVRDMFAPSKCFPRAEMQPMLDIRECHIDINEHTAREAGILPSCIGRFNITNLPKQNPLPYGMEAHKMTMAFFYLSSHKGSDKRGFSDGDPDEGFRYNDREKGIYHFHVGGDSGIFKKCDFEKSDIEGMAEARQAITCDNFSQFISMYNAKLTLAGNTLFIPGMTVFINPPIGMGLPQIDGSKGDGIGSISNLMGMGGYYSVITVESNISRGGEYETVLECKFDGSGSVLDSKAGQCREVLVDMMNRPVPGGTWNRKTQKSLAEEALEALDRMEEGGEA